MELFNFYRKNRSRQPLLGASVSRQGVRQLSKLLTLAFAWVVALGGCAPFENNWIDQKVAAIEAYQTNLGAGASAHDLVSNVAFKSLVVEVSSVPGFAPTQEALNRLQTFLNSSLNKPRGIRWMMGTELPPGTARGYTVQDLKNLENQFRRYKPQKDELTVHLLFLDQHSSDDTETQKILGQAFGNLSIAVFENSLRSATVKDTQSQTPVWISEVTVTEHEFGHLLGLVGLPDAQGKVSPEASALVRSSEDILHPAHCMNPNCLMYHAADTSAALSRAAGILPQLDEACLNYLKQLGSSDAR